MRTKRIRWLWIMPLVVLSMSVAHAGGGGTKVGADVSIVNDPSNALNWIASGALGDARYIPPGTTTAPQVKEIGCWVSAGATQHLSGGGTLPGSQIVTCKAVSASPSADQLQCSSGDPALVAAVGLLKGDSMLTFTAVKVDDPTRGFFAGDCVSIVVENGSKYFPKSP